MKSMKLNAWDREWELYADITKYSYPPNLAIQLYNKDDDLLEPFAMLTVNLSFLCDKNCSFVDVNDCPWVEKFIQDHRIGVPTGRKMRSGYVTYPEYRFDIEELKKHLYVIPLIEKKIELNRDDEAR